MQWSRRRRHRHLYASARDTSRFSWREGNTISTATPQENPNLSTSVLGHLDVRPLNLYDSYQGQEMKKACKFSCQCANFDCCWYRSSTLPPHLLSLHQRQVTFPVKITLSLIEDAALYQPLMLYITLGHPNSPEVTVIAAKDEDTRSQVAPTGLLGSMNPFGT